MKNIRRKRKKPAEKIFYVPFLFFYKRLLPDAAPCIRLRSAPLPTRIRFFVKILNI
jgi:hypothetical protein